MKLEYLCPGIKPWKISRENRGIFEIIFQGLILGHNVLLVRPSAVPRPWMVARRLLATRHARSSRSVSACTARSLACCSRNLEAVSRACISAMRTFLFPVVHRVGAILHTRHPDASIWKQFRVFNDPDWGEHAQKVSDWTSKHKQDAAASAEQAVSNAPGAVNSGPSAKMTVVAMRSFDPSAKDPRLLHPQRWSHPRPRARAPCARSTPPTGGGSLPPT